MVSNVSLRSRTPAVTGRAAESVERLRDIARKAGAEIMRHYSSTAVSTVKADGSPLTLADTAAECRIVEELQVWDSSLPIISEESSYPHFEERKHWRQFWLVDPLDGTKEFISRNGEFTVNIALVSDGEPVLGVVYAPALDLMYTASKGGGAWRSRNGAEPVRIFHDVPAADRPLTIVESRSHPSAALETYLRTIQLGRRLQLGSSLKFCCVAEGEADVYPRLGPTMEWDVAAGDCIYRNSARAGQHASPLAYNKPDLRNDSFVIGLAQ
jgi:3'(2'), 5'-bisphosphate nucleotidase